MQELKMDSDDQGSVCSEESVSSCKSVIYESESSTCDSIITSFKHCTVKLENFQKITLTSVSEEIEKVDDSTNDSDAELPLVQISSTCHSDKTTESAATPTCNDNEEPKKRDNSTNTENYGYKRRKFRSSNTHNKYRPYGYNHKHLNYQHSNNYRSNYQRPQYNNYRQKQFNYTNGYQYQTFCNKWDCEMRHRENLYFRNMLLVGIFHFTKFLEYISQLHF